MPLSPQMGSGAYVDDFVHSKNSRFKGKNKQQRIKMALGAYYGAKKEDNPTSDNPYTASNRRETSARRKRSK